MGYGDEILAAGQAQRYYDQHHRPSFIVDRHERPRWHPIWDGNPAIIRPEDVRHGQHAILSAPHARPYIVYPFTAETGWTFDRRFRARDHRARIYLTESEILLAIQIVCRIGPFVLIDPWSKHQNLRWPIEYWQALVEAHPAITWVQHVYPQVPDAARLRQIILVETNTFRMACALVQQAHCYVRGESGMCHAAAALGVKQVTIWGGCMDWDVLGGYDGQVGVGISTPACGRYLPCTHCQATMAAIQPETVAAALQACLDGHPAARPAQSA